jgi:anti-sigma factor RsiW
MNSELDPSLMAYVDGQMNADEAADFERRLSAEPALQAALLRQRELTQQLRTGFDAVLDEPVPEHLLRLLQATPDAAPTAPVPATPAPLAPVLSLARARAHRQAAAQAQADADAAQQVPAGRGWAQWGGLAASLVLGLGVGHFVWQAPGGDGAVAQADSGRSSLLATGPLAQALNTQLSGESGQGVTPGLSFVAQDGAYCRSFSVAGQGAAAGLACREPAGWRVQALLPLPAGAASTELRMAGTALPPELLRVVDDLRAGDSLDAAAEKAARERGWRR